MPVSVLLYLSWVLEEVHNNGGKIAEKQLVQLGYHLIPDAKIRKAIHWKLQSLGLLNIKVSENGESIISITAKGKMEIHGLIQLRTGEYGNPLPSPLQADC